MEVAERTCPALKDGGGLLFDVPEASVIVELVLLESGVFLASGPRVVTTAFAAGAEPMIGSQASSISS